jgi:hypothetical protein
MAQAPFVLSLVTASFMIAAGVFDSLAFTCSAGIWREGRLVWPQLARAAAFFALGISMYWAGLRYLGAVGVVAPELQTLIWFAVTIIGVTVLGGRFLHWPLLDQLVAANALASLGWLLARSSA